MIGFYYYEEYRIYRNVIDSQFGSREEFHPLPVEDRPLQKTERWLDCSVTPPVITDRPCPSERNDERTRWCFPSQRTPALYTVRENGYTCGLRFHPDYFATDPGSCLVMWERILTTNPHDISMLAPDHSLRVRRRSGLLLTKRFDSRSANLYRRNGRLDLVSRADEGAEALVFTEHGWLLYMHWGSEGSESELAELKRFLDGLRMRNCPPQYSEAELREMEPATAERSIWPLSVFD